VHILINAISHKKLDDDESVSVTRQLLDVREARIDSDAGVSGGVLNLLHAFTINMLDHLLEELDETPFREDDLGIIPVKHACSVIYHWIL